MNIYIIGGSPCSCTQVTVAMLLACQLISFPITIFKLDDFLDKVILSDGAARGCEVC